MFESRTWGTKGTLFQSFYLASEKTKVAERRSSSWLGFVRAQGRKGRKLRQSPCPVPPIVLGCCFWISPGKVLLRLILLPDKMGGETSSVFQWTWMVSFSCCNVEHLILFWLCLSTIIGIVVVNA